MDKKKNPFSKDEQTKNAEQPQEEVIEETNSEVEESADDIAIMSQKVEELSNQYIRMAADFDNYRKRQAQERESLLKYGAENTLKVILPVLDTFERANQSIKDSQDLTQVKESIEVVYKQLLDALQKSGLRTIETQGQKFDPNLHEAVMKTPTEDAEDHTVLQELQKGYMLDDRVLRAALVNVAINDK